MARGREAVCAAGCPESSCTKCLLTPSAASYMFIPTPYHALQGWSLCLPPLPLLSRCAVYTADVGICSEVSNRSFHWQREWESFLKKKITSLFWGLLPMFIKKFGFYLKTWHFKAILFKKLVLLASCSALRLKKTTWKCFDLQPVNAWGKAAIAHRVLSWRTNSSQETNIWAACPQQRVWVISRKAHLQSRTDRWYKVSFLIPSVAC